MGKTINIFHLFFSRLLRYCTDLCAAQSRGACLWVGGSATKLRAAPAKQWHLGWPLLGRRQLPAWPTSQPPL